MGLQKVKSLQVGGKISVQKNSGSDLSPFFFFFLNSQSGGFLQLKFTWEGNFGTCLKGVGALNPCERLSSPLLPSPPLHIPHSLISLGLEHSSGAYCLPCRLLDANLCQVLGKYIF